MDVDVIKAKQIPFKYVSPPVCDFVFSASGTAEVFLNTRSPAGPITGFTITLVDGVYQLRWDSYPGALCYSVYKLVDELDPFSGYVLIAECITDNFYDTTDPGAYVVTPVTTEGEPDFPPPTFTPPNPIPPDCSSPDITGTGKEEYVCPKGITSIDVSGNNSGSGLSVTAASVDKGSVTFSGLTLTFDGPDAGFTGNALVNYTVTDVCGKTAANAVLLHAIEAPTVTNPSLQDVCAGESATFDVRDYVDNLTAEEIAGQIITVTAANVFDVGGALIFGSGPTIQYTANVDGIGVGYITFTAENQCGDSFSGTIPILVVCQCTDAMADVSTGTITGGASGSWSGSFGSASISAVVAPFSGTVPSTNWEELAVTNCVARIVLSGTLLFALVNVNGSTIFSSSTPGTYLVPFSTKIGTNFAGIFVTNGLGGSCTCLVELGPV